MRSEADVRSIDALRDAKAALAEYRDVVRTALSEATAEVQRTIGWLQNDRRTYWEQAVRRRTDKVNQAKSDLYRAQLAAMDDRAPCTEQRKALERAERALQEAHQKVQHVRRWSRLIDREYMLFKGQCQPMARTADGELPRGEAVLDLLLERLEAYVRLQAPKTGGGTSAPAAGSPAPPDGAGGGS